MMEKLQIWLRGIAYTILSAFVIWVVCTFIIIFVEELREHTTRPNMPNTKPILVTCFTGEKISIQKLVADVSFKNGIFSLTELGAGGKVVTYTNAVCTYTKGYAQ